MMFNAPPILVAVFIVILVFSPNPIMSIQFELLPRDAKCIAEEMRQHSMTIGKYSIVNPNKGQPLPESQKIMVSVKTRGGTVYHHADLVEKGQFSFDAVEGGDYIACFWLPDEKSGQITINFDWDIGLDVKDSSKVLTKGSLQAMTMELRMVFRLVGSIWSEMAYLREREEEMWELNRKMNSEMGWLSLLSLIICLSVVGLQVWHLKYFFEKRKLI